MELRKALYNQCQAYADARIKAAYEAIKQAQEAANAEEKSCQCRRKEQCRR